MTDVDSPSEFGNLNCLIIKISKSPAPAVLGVWIILFLPTYASPGVGQISTSIHVGFPLNSEEDPIIVSLFASCLPNRNVISVASKRYASAHVAVNK